MKNCCTRIKNVVIGRIMIVSVLKEKQNVWIELRWNGRKKRKINMRLGKIKARNDWINFEWFRLSDWSLQLDEFESVVESGSDWLNLFFSGKVGLFLCNALYSCSQGLDAHAIGEVPVLDVIVMNFNQIEFFWSVGEAFCYDLVFTNFIYAFTSFEDVACFERV